MLSNKNLLLKLAQGLLLTLLLNATLLQSSEAGGGAGGASSRASGVTTGLSVVEQQRVNQALLTAVRGNLPAAVTVALYGGANVNYTVVVRANDQALPGWTALMIAAFHGNTETVKLLLAAEADVHATSALLVDGQAQRGVNALTVAAANGHTETVKLLLAAGANVHATGTVPMNDQPRHGVTALMLAAGGGHTETVQLLLNARADANAATTTLMNGQVLPSATALMMAVNRDHTEVIKLLLDAGANVNAMAATLMSDGQVRHNWTALMLAAKRGYTESIKLLLTAEANINAVATVVLENGQVQPDGGDTALMIATDNGHIETVKILLAAKANVHNTTTVLIDNERVQPNWTALMMAIDRGHAEIVQLLLAADADLSVTQELLLSDANRAMIANQRTALASRATALLAAAIAGNRAVVEALSVLPLRDRTTVLNQALLAVTKNSNLTFSRFTELVNFLLSQGADINYRAPIDPGVTESETSKEAVTVPQASSVLDLAILQNQLTRVQYLLERGADPFQLTEATQIHLGAFTPKALVTSIEDQTTELAKLRELRKTELQSSSELSAAAQVRYLDDALNIAKIIADKTMDLQAAARTARLAKAKESEIRVAKRNTPDEHEGSGNTESAAKRRRV